MLKIAVLGAGRMAQEIIKVINDSDSCCLGGVWARSDNVVSGITASDQLPEVFAGADVAIDFTLASATTEILRQAVAARKPLVCGVSGLDKSQMQLLADASRQVPLLYDRNMSYGIAVLTRLVHQLGTAFTTGFSSEIHETHHRHKIDAPSGTALLLGEALAESRGQSFDEVYDYNPDGNTEPASNAIKFVVSREGEVPGDHSVVFHNATETVTLTHSVADRRVFAEGAVKAAHWLVNQPVGRYRMVDLLNQ